MALITDEQMHQIKEIIRDHHAAFVVNTIGPDAVSPETLERLRTKGLVAVEMAAINEAYVYGQHVASGVAPSVATMSYADFLEHIRKNPTPPPGITSEQWADSFVSPGDDFESIYLNSQGARTDADKARYRTPFQKRGLKDGR